MKKHHKVILGTFGTLVTIFMIVVAFILNGIIIKQTIENNQLKDQITKLDLESNNKINELAAELIRTKQVLQTDLTTINQDLLTLNEDLTSTTKELSVLKVDSAGDFSGVIETAIESIVIIRTLTGQGSGFFIDDTGYIATNAHVLADPNGDLSSLIQAVTKENEIYSADFIGYISELDLALIKISKDSVPLELENSDNVNIGEKVIAIGTPQGLSFSVTDGIVSAVKRIGDNNLEVYIQTNANLNPGNSGGPLINKEGKVIGMNNFKLTDAEGIGFALESNKIKEGVNLISSEMLNQTLIR